MVLGIKARRPMRSTAVWLRYLGWRSVDRHSQNLSSPQVKKQSLPAHWPITLSSKSAHPSQIPSLNSVCVPNAPTHVCACLQVHIVFYSVFACVATCMRVFRVRMCVCTFEPRRLCQFVLLPFFSRVSLLSEKLESAPHILMKLSHNKYTLWLNGFRTFLQWRINKLSSLVWSKFSMYSRNLYRLLNMVDIQQVNNKLAVDWDGFTVRS